MRKELNWIECELKFNWILSYVYNAPFDTLYCMRILRLSGQLIPSSISVGCQTLTSVSMNKKDANVRQQFLVEFLNTLTVRLYNIWNTFTILFYFTLQYLKCERRKGMQYLLHATPSEAILVIPFPKNVDMPRDLVYHTNHANS